MRKLLNLSTLFLVVIPSISITRPASGFWAEEELTKMNLDQKIGQLIMVSVGSEDSEEQVNAIKDLIHKQGIGGLIFMGGKALKQSDLARQYREISQWPLLVSQDAEWGFNMRLPDVIRFPKNMTLGAIPKEYGELLFKMGQEIGKHGKLLGVNMNLAPVVDVNNNSQNPVIHMRSFGENPEEVAEKATLIMKGMQSEGMRATAKHFTGHGDTNVDSHLALPVINHDLSRLERVEFLPFKYIIDNDIDAVMSAHIHVPSLDSTPNLPCTLSPKIMTEQLKERLGFKGLAITDSLTMQGVTKHFPISEASVKSLQAGNHILLYASGASNEKADIVKQSVPESITAIKEAILTEKLSIEQIDSAALAVLRLKEKIKDQPFEELKSLDQINTPEALELKKNLYRYALTLAKNEGRLLPILNESHNKTLVMVLNGAEGTSSIFANSMSEAGIKNVSHKIDSPTPNTEPFLKDCENYDTVVLAIYNFTLFLREEQKRKNLEGMQKLTQDLVKNGKKVIAVLFGTPYGLPYFKDANALLLAYEEDLDVEALSTKMILGEIKPTGKLPVTPCAEFPAGLGLSY